MRTLFAFNTRWLNKFIKKSFPRIVFYASEESEVYISASQYRICDNKAAIFIEKYYDRILSDFGFDKIKRIVGEDLADSMIKRRLISELSEIYRALYYANEIRQKVSDASKVYLWSGGISYLAYKMLLKYQPKDVSVRIPLVLRLIAQGVYILKSLISFFKSAVFLERLMPLSRIKVTIPEVSQFKLGVHLNGSHDFTSVPSIDFFAADGVVTENDIVYVADERWPSQYIDGLRKNSNSVVDLSRDARGLLSFAQFMKRIYFPHLVYRVRVMWAILRYPYLSKDLYETLKSRVLWSIFYARFSVNKFMAIMGIDHVSSIYEHAKRKVETIFLYLSSTSRCCEKIDLERTACHEYAYMKFDTLISGKTSINWFQSVDCNIGNYVDVGVMCSDIVVKNKTQNRGAICNRLGLKSSDVVLGYFDHTVGHKGVFTHEEYSEFLMSMKTLLDTRSDCVVVLKSKKSPRLILENLNDEVKIDFEALLKHERFRIANDHQVNVFELIGLSDLVISAPLSSVIGISLAAGVNMVTYDPGSKYNFPDIIENELPGIRAKNSDELLGLVEHWMNLSEDEYRKFKENYIKPLVDQYSDGRAVQRLRDHLTIGE